LGIGIFVISILIGYPGDINPRLDWYGLVYLDYLVYLFYSGKKIKKNLSSLF